MITEKSIRFGLTNAEGGLVISAVAENYDIPAGYADRAYDAFECPAEFIRGFEIAGADEEYKPANVKVINEGGKIIFELFSPDVKHPCHAAYGRHNWQVTTVFGRNGLPLAPFLV